MKRKLKVEMLKSRTQRGDDDACPFVRLKGKWMKQAGFHPGAYIDVTAISPGVIELRISAPAQLTGEAFQIMGRLDRAIERTAKVSP